MGGLPLSGWWVLIAIGVVGLLLLGIATAYLLLSPTKSAVTLPPRQVPVAPVPSANAQWTPAPPMTADALPMTMPMPQHPSTPPAPFVSPDATVPLQALTGAMLDRIIAGPATAPMPATAAVEPAAPLFGPTFNTAPTNATLPSATASSSPSAPPPASVRSKSKAPLPLRANATMVSASAPSLTPPPLPSRSRPPLRTLPPPGSRKPVRPFTLATMAPSKAAEVLALSLDSDLPPPMNAPHAPDTERSMDEDDAPTMATTWESMTGGKRGTA